MNKGILGQKMKTGIFCTALFWCSILMPFLGFSYVSIDGMDEPFAWIDAASLAYFLLFWAFLLYAIFRRDYGIIRAYFIYSVFSLSTLLLYPLYVEFVLGPIQPMLSAAERLIKMGALGYGTDTQGWYFPYDNYIIYIGFPLTMLVVAISFISFFHQRKCLRRKRTI